MTLRDAFPVLARLAYLNAGTDGPVPEAAVAAARAEWEREARDGRTRAHFERRQKLEGELRRAYAARLAADPAEVSLTTSTTDGIVRVLGGLGLGEGAEVVTAEDEHPGLLGPLGALARRGVSVRAVPFAELPDAVGPHTGLVACSHVSWVSGEVRPEALATVEVPVLLDGAQGVGAVPVDVGALGCAAYAGSGQKWLCGPDGLGMLWVSPALRERMTVPSPGYTNLSRPGAGLEAEPWPDGRALDSPSLAPENLAAAVASHAVLEQEGWSAVHARARELAERLAGLLREHGREVAPRGPTTLVTFSSADPETEVARLSARGVVVRPLPARPELRASVGAWNDESDLERLLAALG